MNPPAGVTLIRHYEPDPAEQVKALVAVLKSPGGKPGIKKPTGCDQQAGEDVKNGTAFPTK